MHSVTLDNPQGWYNSNFNLSPNIPIGRENGLKNRPVWIRLPLGRPNTDKIQICINFSRFIVVSPLSFLLLFLLHIVCILSVSFAVNTMSKQVREVQVADKPVEFTTPPPLHNENSV